MSATLPNLEILTDNQMKAVHLIKDREKIFSSSEICKTSCCRLWITRSENDIREIGGTYLHKYYK